VEPTWDLSSFFPSFDSPETSAFVAKLDADFSALLADAEALPSLSEASRGGFVELVLRYEDGLSRFGHLSSYVTCLASGDAENPRYAAAEGRLGLLRASLEKTTGELRRVLGVADEHETRALYTEPRLEGAVHFLEQLRVDAKKRMPAALEALAADLGTDGIFAWGRLYDTVSAKLTFELEHPDGRKETVPMARRRSLMADPDRRVRRAAFDSGNRAWASVGDVTSAAINRIAGTRLSLYRRRGVDHFLDVALHEIGRAHV
jgi:oligoendopeptidase F